ncbi:hypothetical protein AB8A05_08135 [Tardiphaga sp. 538_B7_N1_4]|jgi:hypothetical protein|uniref:hypothetical protein n=1 Tax=Tardiphaga sp. 538_B7_N1_4 TaxID=3240778 RepID=UPI003F2536F6
MTEKLINVGIFWLPLIAGIILGGMSPSVWYGGDKISALWMTFFGIALLLLTATFQIQSYIQTTILQPQFEVSKPEQKSVLTWNPPSDNSMNIKGENDNLPPGGWRVPIFTIKNSTPVNAQDVTVRWSAAKYDPSTLTSGKAIFQGRQITIANNLITLSAAGGMPFQNPIQFSTSLDKPFITRSAETFLPLDVWNTAALYFLSSLPAQTGERSEPYYFDLEISWNIPENAKPARYRIKTVATNIKTPGTGPEFKASIDFSVEKAE